MKDRRSAGERGAADIRAARGDGHVALHRIGLHADGQAPYEFVADAEPETLRLSPRCACQYQRLTLGARRAPARGSVRRANVGR